MTLADRRLRAAAAEARHALDHGWDESLPHVPSNEELADLFITSAEEIIEDRANGHQRPPAVEPRCHRCHDTRLIRDALGIDVCPACEGEEW